MAIVDLRLFKVSRYGVIAAALDLDFFQVKQRAKRFFNACVALCWFVVVSVLRQFQSYRQHKGVP